MTRVGRAVQEFLDIKEWRDEIGELDPRPPDGGLGRESSGGTVRREVNPR